MMAHPLLRSILRFAGAVLRRFHEDDGLRLCASLAYTSLFAIVPVVTVGLAVFAAFPAFDDFTRSIQRFFAANMLPSGVAQTTLSYIDQFARNAAQLTAVGTVAVAITAFLLMGTIEKAFDEIWGQRRTRPLVVRLFMYWGVMTLGPVLMGASLTMSSYLIAHAAELTADWPWISEMILKLVPLVLTASALTLLYYVVPGRTPAFVHAVAGGVAAALIFELTKYGFALYVRHFASFTLVYGTLAAFPVFLMWLYASWVVVALGAEITALAPDFGHVSPRLPSRGEPAIEDLVAVLRPLIRARLGQRLVSSRRARHESARPLEIVEAVLGRLAARGLVGRVSTDRFNRPGADQWTLLADPQQTTLGAVYVAFALPKPSRRRATDGADDAITERLAAGVQRALDEPLVTLVGDEDLATEVKAPN